MLTSEINQITDYLFNNDVVFQPGAENSLPPHIKDKLQTVYLSHQTDKPEHETPVSDRKVQLVDVLPYLAQTPSFFEKLNSHAEAFCRSIGCTHTTEIKNALMDVGSLKTLSDVGGFFESILNKCDGKRRITDSEKIVFKYLLTGMFRMDCNLDANNSSRILKTLTLYFHPDKSDCETELYKCVLNKGVHLAKVLKDLWDVQSATKHFCQSSKDFELPEDQLIESISNLLFYEGTKAYLAFKEIEKVIKTAKTLGQKDGFKEALLLTVIKCNQPGLLKALMGREDFDINELSINNETPLIYAIKNASQEIVQLLIEKQGPNTHGLEGKTPLQIAIDCYCIYPENEKVMASIESLLACHNLNVDDVDSDGMTALCHIAVLPKLDASCFQFIKTLIGRGANIDHPVQGHGTVRSLLEKKLNQEQFSDMEILADNLVDITNGVRFHGDEVVDLIERCKQFYESCRFGDYSEELRKVKEAIINAKTLRQKKGCKKTVLMAVIEFKVESLAKLLLRRRDFAFNQLTTKGENSLNYAVQMGSDDIVRLLINDAKVDINTPGLDNKTPLSRSIYCYNQFNDRVDFRPLVGVANHKNPYLPIIRFLLTCKGVQVSAQDSFKLDMLAI